MALNDKDLDVVVKLFEENLLKSYSRGLAVGGKAFVGSIHNLIMESDKPAEEVIEDVKAMCENYLGTNELFLSEE